MRPVASPHVWARLPIRSATRWSKPSFASSRRRWRMNGSQKIQATHLSRQAVIYISSLIRIVENWTSKTASLSKRPVNLRESFM